MDHVSVVFPFEFIFSVFHTVLVAVNWSNTYVVAWFFVHFQARPAPVDAVVMAVDVDVDNAIVIFVGLVDFDGFGKAFRAATVSILTNMPDLFCSLCTGKFY